MSSLSTANTGSDMYTLNPEHTLYIVSGHSCTNMEDELDSKPILNL
jgi:hypothetical protein